jgi:hypothetical protein
LVLGVQSWNVILAEPISIRKEKTRKTAAKNGGPVMQWVLMKSDKNRLRFSKAKAQRLSIVQAETYLRLPLDNDAAQNSIERELPDVGKTSEVHSTGRTSSKKTLV